MKGISVVTRKIAKTLHIKHWHVIAAILILYDAIAVNLAYMFALLARFDFHYSAVPRNYLNTYLHIIPYYTIACIIVFLLMRLYRTLWQFASYAEMIRTVWATLITTAIMVAGTMATGHRMPHTFYFIGAIIQFGLVLGIRFSYRFVLLMREGARGKRVSKNIMLIGAGAAGQALLRDIKRAKEVDGHVVCIVDDNPNKWNRYIDGVPVVGNRDVILENVEKYEVDQIYIAMPSASAQERRDIIAICQETNCEIKNLPGMYQFVTGQVTASQMKEVSVEDLLGRDPIQADMQEVYDFVNNKVVLVTGGGGSIGSELCRQIAQHGPKQLIIFDVYENNAYDIQLELREKYPYLNLVTLIGSVRDSRKIFQVFEKYRPDIVYHAAAHKHVPLMEDSPCESIKNNVIGTYKTAYAAMTHGCKRFVLISTDKAVNPTNIMGASKRLCEMVIQSFDAKIKEGKAYEIPQLFTHMGMGDRNVDPNSELFQDIQTQFVAVRFGNVLGSNGSVIPIFKKQIEKGGPVTVTHPDIIRYFMTIPEAVSLVMLAGTYAKGGEIFVLDMGSPVKIADMAKNLIRLSGYKPGVDIKIEFTGLRPGEKLYEEKLMAEEGLQKTENKLIFIGHPIPFDRDKFLTEQLGHLMEVSYKNKDDKIRDEVMSVVSTYKPA